MHISAGLLMVLAGLQGLGERLLVTAYRRRAEQLRPHVMLLSRVADTLLLAYPNAGLPNELGEYDEMPDTTAALVREWAEAGQVNVLGGCCGSTPAHIAAIAKAAQGLPPRALPVPEPLTRLAGLEPFILAA